MDAMKRSWRRTPRRRPHMQSKSGGRPRRRPLCFAPCNAIMCSKPGSALPPSRGATAASRASVCPTRTAPRPSSSSRGKRTRRHRRRTSHGGRAGEALLRRRADRLHADRPGPFRRRSGPAPDLRRAAQGRLRRDSHLRRACKARGRECAASRAGCRRRDGTQSGAADHPLPSRACGRRQARRLLGAGPHGDQGKACSRSKACSSAVSRACCSVQARAKPIARPAQTRHIATRSFRAPRGR